MFVDILLVLLMLQRMSTVFVYADESGQDDRALFFGVSIVMLSAIYRDKLLIELENIEVSTKKRNRKWHGSYPAYRRAYIESISDLGVLRDKIFYKKYPKENKYLDFTVDAIACALRHSRPERIVIYMDGLPKGSIPKFKRQLKPSIKAPAKVRGVRKDENNSLIRLADAICGVVRDAYEGDVWARKMLQRFKKRGLLTEL